MLFFFFFYSVATVTPTPSTRTEAYLATVSTGRKGAQARQRTDRRSATSHGHPTNPTLYINRVSNFWTWRVILFP
jgi:hypothetical protein